MVQRASPGASISWTWHPFDRQNEARAVPDFAGPLAGILTRMEWAASHGADRLATFAEAVPFFPTDLVGRLGEAAVAPDMISVATSGDRNHYVFGLWATTLAGGLRKFLESGTSRAVRKLLKTTQGSRSTFPRHQSIHSLISTHQMIWWRRNKW